MNNEGSNKGVSENLGKTPMSPKEFKRQKRLIAFRKRMGYLLLGSFLAIGIGNEILKDKKEDKKIEIKAKPKPDRHFPQEQVFTDEERARRDALIAKGLVNASPDEFTNNYLDKVGEAEDVREPLVKRVLFDKSGKGYEVIAKKSVMERFLAAWKVLNEAGIYFTGSASHFSTNIVQDGIISRLSEGEAGKTMNMAQGSHVRGTAIDVSQIGKNVPTNEGRKIGQVLRIFGFGWAVKEEIAYSEERAKNVAKNTWNKIGDKIDKMKIRKRIEDVASGKTTTTDAYAKANEDLKIAYAELANGFGEGDYVHVSMGKTRLERAPSIAEATAKARMFLELPPK